MPIFLTALAPEAQVKGSRDPLGFLPIWSRLGRRLIRNVTTVSGDLRGWTTLLIAVGMVRTLEEQGRVPALARDEVFFRAEQLIGYSRVLYGEGSEVRGVTRMRSRLRDTRNGSQPLDLGTRADQRILGSQRSAGVWGQISRSADASGLIDRKRLVLLPTAATVWTTIWQPALAPHWRAIREVLTGSRGFSPSGRDEGLARALAMLVTPELAPAELPLVVDHVLRGDRPVEDDQGQLVEAWLAQGTDRGLDLAAVLDLAQVAEDRGASSVGRKLRDIVDAERLLGPAELLFRWTLTRDRAPLADLVADLTRDWAPIPAAAHADDALLRPPAEHAYPGIGMPDALGTIRSAMVTADWETALLGLIELNRRIMAVRQGAPWVVLHNGVLDVRLRDEHAGLPALHAVTGQLVHNFYLDPLRRLIRAWELGRG